MMDPDRIQGMLFGVALGDALGGPFEFTRRHDWQKDYTGLLDRPLTIMRRFQGGKKVGVLGQITDDTEMTIALASTLENHGSYNQKAAAMSYIEWANSGCLSLGRNTKALFVGIKTYSGYRGRHDKIFSAPISEWTQSNGCLMRASPLALIAEDTKRHAAVSADCSLTNPHPTCVISTQVYIALLHCLLQGESIASATAEALREIDGPGDAQDACIQGIRGEARDITSQKGWVCHALYCTFYALHHGSSESNPGHSLSFARAIDLVILKGGDTDTNAAIAGAALGAYIGLKKMSTDSKTKDNLVIIIKADPNKGQIPRPERYGNAELVRLSQSLAELFGSSFDCNSVYDQF